MDGNMKARVEFLEKQMSSIVGRYNAQEDKIQRLEFDMKFLQAWAKEHCNSPESTLTGKGIQ